MIPTKKNTAEDYLLSFFISKKWSIVRHIGLIVISAVAMFPQKNLTIDFLKNAGEANPTELLNSIYLTYFFLFIEALATIYINLFILIPKLLLRNKFMLYLLSCIAMVGMTVIIELSIPDTIIKYLPVGYVAAEFSLKSILEATTMAFVFLIATAGYRVFKKWLQDTQQLAAIKEATLKEELTNLKNQINPHFLFNTLNNLNTLITTNAGKASAVVLGLSDVLRFYLYEADKDLVLLKKDTDILKQVLELAKIRRDDFQFSIGISNNINSIMVPPLIFTNFVENAIKHSICDNAFSFVNIQFSVEANYLLFDCENSTPQHKSVIKAGGLGLKNIQRRLDLIYGHAYSLTINETNNRFTVKLKLPLEKNHEVHYNR